jgi:hypothetical protein
MRSIAVLVLFLLGCSASQVDEPPVFGIWEQMAAADAHSTSEIKRRDIIFSDKKIVGDTVFSALSRAYAGTICCLRVKNPSPIRLSDLLVKYKWTADDVAHLKNIKGWSYIYEANLVEIDDQNKNMQDLVRNLSNPGDISPFSAAVVSARLAESKKAVDHFSLNGKNIKFASVYVEQKDIFTYTFYLDGEQVIFSEESFPSE